MNFRNVQSVDRKRMFRFPKFSRYSSINARINEWLLSRSAPQQLDDRLWAQSGRAYRTEKKLLSRPAKFAVLTSTTAITAA